MKKIFLYALLLFCFNANAAETTDKHLLNEMLTTINNEYLQEINNVDIIAIGLTALQDLDRNITISKGSDKFYIYNNRQIQKAVRFPHNSNDITGWIDTISEVIESSSQISDNIALKDFEIPDLMMKKMMTHLDPYSHYYSEYDYNEDEEDNAIYTLYSDRKIGTILYLRIRIFNKQTARMVRQSLESNPDIKGVIMDLRSNGGGMLNAALKTADLFCENEIITYTSGRDGKNTHYYTATEGALFTGPMVIIIDGETASAAEVLAGGLQEQSRAKLIGARSFGKGTIQNVTQMSNKGRLVLTTEQFFTPSGKIIHGNGITPDVCLSKAKDGLCLQEKRLNNDDDLRQAIKILQAEIPGSEN
ncbi:MAG: S41 family peptidase [Alphaproteobacteria bacterium]|nr:S41 family peptidase [Alphaproteobacteria bacterium]